MPAWRYASASLALTAAKADGKLWQQPRSETSKRLLVVGQIKIFLRRARRDAAPVGAKLEHVREPFHVELRVLGQAFGGVDRDRIGCAGDVLWQFQSIGEQPDGFVLVLRIERPAQPFDVSLHVFH